MASRSGDRTIADAGEFGFLSALLPRLSAGRGTIVGPGQDCAVICCGRARVLLTIDALVEDVHFRTAWLSPHQIGRKCFLVNASDVAAMGGRPRACVVSLCVPPSYLVRDLSALQAGIVQAAGEVGAFVVGGNLSRAAQLSISIALLADAPRRLVTRQGARPGDQLYITGTLGDAALAVHLLRSARRARALPARIMRRFQEPPSRLLAGRALVESGIVSAMIDVSDGLVQDLHHICEESRVGGIIDAARVPLSAAHRTHPAAPDGLALHGGEDYELLCTIPERNVTRLQRMRGRLGCPITHIGEITSRRGVRVLDRTGKTVKPRVTGYDHFLSGAKR